MGKTVTGRCSEFGGPADIGMGPHEPVALYTAKAQAPAGLFSGDGVRGRDLNPDALYCAMRWDYNETPISYLHKITVAVTANGKTVHVHPVDWGPNARTGRVIDLSPGALKALGVETDATVTATYVLPGEAISSSIQNGSEPPVPQQNGSISSSATSRPEWPLQRDCTAFYGDPYQAGWLHANTVDVPCPWPLRVEGAVRSSILINKRCADSLARALAAIWERCGKDPHKIAALKYDVFDGSYNLRPMRGSSQISMHSYACAIDFDADENEFHGPRHTFTPDSIIVEEFEREGWTWGGRWSAGSKDWMHFQAARVSGAAAVPVPPALPHVSAPASPAPTIAPPAPAPARPPPLPSPAPRISPMPTPPIAAAMPPELQEFLRVTLPLLDTWFPSVETALVTAITADRPMVGQAVKFVLDAGRTIVRAEAGLPDAPEAPPFSLPPATVAGLRALLKEFEPKAAA